MRFVRLAHYEWKSWRKRWPIRIEWRAVVSTVRRFSMPARAQLWRKRAMSDVERVKQLTAGACRRSCAISFPEWRIAKPRIGVSAVSKANQAKASKSASLAKRLVYGATSPIRLSILAVCWIYGCKHATWTSKRRCTKRLTGLGILCTDQTAAHRHRESPDESPARLRFNVKQQRFDWRSCIEALTVKHLERLAEWRGYSIEFCSWLHKQGLVGLHDGLHCLSRARC